MADQWQMSAKKRPSSLCERRSHSESACEAHSAASALLSAILASQ